MHVVLRRKIELSLQIHDAYKGRDTRVRYHLTAIAKALEEDGTMHAVISEKADEDPA